MATEPAYRLNWQAGEKKLLLVSVGTGAAESLGATAASPNKNIVSTVAGLPGELMYGIQIDQDINCRTVGRRTHGAFLDREILDRVPRQVLPGFCQAGRWKNSSPRPRFRYPPTWAAAFCMRATMQI
jgi:hypothetical protein